MGGIIMKYKCPKCGSKNLSFHAFSIDEDCYVVCDDCGFSLETSVSWDGCNSEEEHDKKCGKALIKMLEDYVDSKR